MNAAAAIVGVTVQSVMRWINKFYLQYKDMPQPDGEVKEVEIDEMFSYINKKNTKSGFGKYYVIIPKGLSHGFVAIVVQKH